MSSIHSPYAEARPSVLHQKHSVGGEALTIAQPHSEQNHRAQWWRRVAYQAVLLPVLFLGALAWLRRDFSNPEIPDWKPVLTLADTTQEKAICTTQRVCIQRWGGAQLCAKIGRG